MPPMSSFGSARDHQRLLRIRATMDAVLCGRRTIESGPIDLGTGGKRYENMRIANGLNRLNRKIILTGSGNLNPACKVFESEDAPILIATTQQGKRDLESVFKKHRHIEIRSFGEKSVNLHPLVTWLYEHWQINRLVLEGGGQLNDALFRNQLVDEIFLTVAPLVFGGSNHSTISDGIGFTSLEQAATFQCIQRRCSRGEMFLTYRRAKVT